MKFRKRLISWLLICGFVFTYIPVNTVHVDASDRTNETETEEIYEDESVTTSDDEFKEEVQDVPGNSPAKEIMANETSDVVVSDSIKTSQPYGVEFQAEESSLHPMYMAQDGYKFVSNANGTFDLKLTLYPGSDDDGLDIKRTIEIIMDERCVYSDEISVPSFLPTSQSFTYIVKNSDLVREGDENIKFAAGTSVEIRLTTTTSKESKEYVGTVTCTPTGSHIITTIYAENVGEPLLGQVPKTDFSVKVSGYYSTGEPFRESIDAAEIDWLNTYWYLYLNSVGVGQEDALLKTDNNGGIVNPGRAYGLHIEIKTKENYIFASSTPVKVYINGYEEGTYVRRSGGTRAAVEKEWAPMSGDPNHIIGAVVKTSGVIPKENRSITDDMVPLLIDERIKLSGVSFWAVYTDESCTNYRLLPGGYKFEAGKTYLMQESFQNKAGYTLDKDFKIVVNNSPSCEFELERFSFVHYSDDPSSPSAFYIWLKTKCVEINTTKATIVPPQPGASPSYTKVSVPEDACYTASVKWVTNDSAQTPVTKFESGHEYRAIVTYNAKPGYHFGDYMDDLFESTINDSQAERGGRDKAGGQQVTFWRVFACGQASQDAIEYISVDNIPEPVMGEETKYGTPTITTQNGTVDETYAPLTLDEYNTVYTEYKNGFWYSMEDVPTFTDGHYGMRVVLKVNRGYTLLDDRFVAKVNGREAKVTLQKFALPLGTHIILDIDFNDPISEDEAICKHTFTNKLTPAKLSEDGYIENLCSKCGYIKKVTMIDKIDSVKLSQTKFVYDGKVKKPTITVKDGKGKVIDASSYSISYLDSSGKTITSPINYGNYSVKVKFKGNYKGTYSYAYSIGPKKTTIGTPIIAADGITVKWTKNTSGSGYYIYRSVDGGSYKNVKTITSNATVSWKDTGAKTNGAKYQYKIVTYKKVDGTTYKSANSSVKTIYFVKRPSISSLTNSAKSTMLAKWSKNSKANGYQIQYSTSSSFSSPKSVTITSNATVSKKITGLTKGKTYYVRMRSYKTVGSTKYYSAWSASKSVKITK